MVYKRFCVYHFELLSTAGFQAYSVNSMPVGLLGLMRAWILAHYMVSSCIQAVSMPSWWHFFLSREKWTFSHGWWHQPGLIVSGLVPPR